MGSLKACILITCLIVGVVFNPVLVRAEEDPDDIFDIETDSGSSDDDYDDVDDANKAFLLVKKTLSVDPPRVVQGSNVTITVEIYNGGKSSAKSISAVDSVSSSFAVVEGKTSASAASLAPGASFNFVYTIAAKASGVQYLSPVEVKYISSDDDSKLATASVPKPLLVMTPTENIVHNVLKVGAYATFGAIHSTEQWIQVGYGAAGITLVLVLLWGYNALRSANKRWKYQRALKEVEKMQ